MEFHEKLQELRKQKGLTQEELASALYVSRTAVSKWESGRGYPNIDSLKAIARFFSVTIDVLLSGEEVLTIAEEDRKEKDTRTRNVVFGLLDCSSAMFFLLPFFGQKSGEMIQAVSLLSLSGVSPWLRAAYFTVVVGMTVWGLLILGNCPLLRRMRHTLSLGFSAVGAFLFIISLQPYAAALVFIFLAIKVLMLVKWQ